MNGTIRPMKQEDFCQMMHIYKEGIASNMATFEQQAPDYDTWDKGHLKEGRLVVEQEGKVVAFACLSPTSARAAYRGVVEDSVYVTEDCRGEGLGKALLLSLIDIADAAGFWTIQAVVMEENEASIQLHQSVGFRLVGRRDKIARDAFGLWRSTVLLERRSRKIGFEGCQGCDGHSCPIRN